MHDFSLGGPVDAGEYMGPLLNGKPIHKGNCLDGVHGCTRCSAVARTLTPDQMRACGLDPDEKGYCERCNKDVPIKDIITFKAWDEPVQYEYCSECYKVYQKSIPEPEWDDETYYPDSFDDNGEE